MKATLYYEDGKTEAIIPKNGKRFKREEIQFILKGPVQGYSHNGKVLFRKEPRGEGGPNKKVMFEWIVVNKGKIIVVYGNAIICDKEMTE